VSYGDGAVMCGCVLTVWVVGRFRAPEALFQPSFLGLEAAGIHETTYVFIPWWTWGWVLRQLQVQLDLQVRPRHPS
jgi:hypothetical protein